MAKIESYAQGIPDYVELTTTDQEAARAFYTGMFGWDYERVPMDREGHYYLVASLEGDMVAGIAGQPPGATGRPAYWGVYLAVDDLDATLPRVTAAGGTVVAGPFDVMEQGRMAVIADPTGARVGLWQAHRRIGTERANEPGTPTWHELMSPDLPTATRFYADVLGVGWEATTMEGGEYTCLVVDGRQVAGAMNPPMEGIPPSWSVYFDVENVDDSVAWAQELGGTVVAPPFDVPGVGRLAVLADPQGGIFDLMQPETAA